MAELLTPVRLGTTSNINLSIALTPGIDKIDGVIVTQGMRILLKAQTDRVENGIYVVQGTGYLTRATDFAAGALITCGTAVFIQEGVLLENTGWVVNLYTESNSTELVVGTDPIVFERFSVNLNLDSADIASAIVLRSVKGYPLTIAELDNNFKWLTTTLNQKLNTSDFNPENIAAKVNSLTAEAASLDAWELRGLSPSGDVKEYSTIPIRDENGNIYATNFHGELVGNASTATLADYATLANNVDGVVAVVNGGTGADNPKDARVNLGALGVEGNEAMVGKLTLASASTSLVSLKITPGSDEPSDVAPTLLENGDVWASSQYLRYYLNGKKQSIAHIDSPEFTGTPRAPTKSKETNTTALATTQFVQYHVTDINAALALKAPIASPAFTGTPTAPTVTNLADSSTKIATTGFVQNRLDLFDNNYYTRSEIDIKNAAIEQNRSVADTGLQNQIEDLKKNLGIPVGSVVYFAANSIPLGYLKCDGGLVSRYQYERLFQVIGYTYGGSGDNFRLPDLRGEFIRGFDDGRGVDSGRQFATLQDSTNKSHTHALSAAGEHNHNISDPGHRHRVPSGGSVGSSIRYETSGPAYYSAQNTDLATTGITITAAPNHTHSIDSNGAAEARPRNVALMPCIKAFGNVDDADQIAAQSVIASINGKVNRTGDTMTGFLSLAGNPTASMHAATKQYVDNAVANIGNVYTKAEIDVKVTTLTNDRSSGDANLQAQIDDLKNNTGVPVGSIVYYAANSIPIGFLKCDGSFVSKTSYPRLFEKIGYTYGRSGETFGLPDLRGEFIRGFDDGRGADSGRAFGSWQRGSLNVNDPNYGSFNISSIIGRNNYAGGTTGEVGTEFPIEVGLDRVNRSTYPNCLLVHVAANAPIELGTSGFSFGMVRPRNVAMMPCIKAFGSVDDPDQILAQDVINSVNGKVNRSGDTMTGFLSLAAAPTADMHAATKKYVDTKFAAVQVIQGPQGPAGPQGPQGPAGAPGSSLTVTSGASHTVSYTNIVGGWGSNNYFDVYPPYGKTMSNLQAFIASIWYIAFAGDVDGNDSIRCTYERLGDRMRVWVQNTEQRDRPAASWLAVWS